MAKGLGTDGEITLKTDTAMEQRTTWMRFLLIGISAVILTTGCGKEDIEYRMTVELVYSNQTDSLISFEILEHISSSTITEVELEPFSSSPTFSYDYEGVSRVVEPESCCDDFLTNVYTSRGFEGESKTITLNDTLCVTQLNEKSVLISNYSHEEIANRHFRYTYMFTKNDFENAKPCE